MKKEICRFSVSLVLSVSFTAMVSCGDKQPKPGGAGTAPANAPSIASTTGASQQKVQEAIDQITLIMNNVKSWKERGHRYSDLTPARAIADGIVPKQMIGDSGGIVNPWKGPVSIDPFNDRDSFVVVFSNVPAPDCVQLYSQGKSLFTVQAGTFGAEPTNEEQAKRLCETGNMWFMPK